MTRWTAEGAQAMRREIMRTAILCCAIALTACGRRAADSTPDGAVRELVDRMGRVQGDLGDAKAAYALLSKHAQANLAARAHRYSDASGKTIAPEAMLVPARFLVRFEPQRYTARVSGPAARVDVTGVHAGDHAQVACVFEEGAWKVDLALPSLPPLQVRPGSGQP